MSGNHFIAIVPENLKANPDLKTLLGKMKRTLNDRDREARFTPPDLWHITLTFLGRQNEEQANQTAAALKSWRPSIQQPLELKISGVGAFPAPTEGRVLWLGVQNSVELKKLKVDLDNHLIQSGIEIHEDQSFVPHLTVARLRNMQSLMDLVQLGGRKSFGTYRIGELILFQSVVQANMTKYIVSDRRKL